MEKNIEKHKPPKYVVKFIESIKRYCENNTCEMCPYIFERYDGNSGKTYQECMFESARFGHPCNNPGWKQFINVNSEKQ